MQTIREYFNPVVYLSIEQLYLIEKTINFQINKIKKDIEEIKNSNLNDEIKNILIKRYEEDIVSNEKHINELLSPVFNEIVFNKNLTDNEIDKSLKSNFNLDDNINANLKDFELVIESAEKNQHLYPTNIINEIKNFKGKIKFKSFRFNGFIEELPQILYDVFKINLMVGENKHFLIDKDIFNEIMIYETKSDFPIKHLIFFNSKGYQKTLIFDGFNYINYYHPNTVL